MISTRVRLTAFPLVLSAVILLVYARALQVSFLSDDYIWLLFARFSPLDWSIFAPDPTRWFPFHRPLGALAWKLLYGLFGLNAAGYHLFSLLLHWLNSLLVVAFVSLFTSRLSVIALSAGVLFALLPLHSETVIWLSCLFDLLGTGWYLAALVCLLIAWRQQSAWWYLASLGAFQFCLWSKESAFTVPAMVVVLALLAPDRPRLRTALLMALPYGLLASANLLQRYLVWGSIGGYSGLSYDLAAFVWDRMASAVVVMMAPLNRRLFPPYMIQLSLLAMAGLLFAGMLVGIYRRMILLAGVWLSVVLLPVLNVLPVGEDLQNGRLLYLPAVGFCIGLAAAIIGLARQISARRSALIVAGSVALLSVAYAAALQVHIGPWLVASRALDEIAVEINRLVPHPRPGSLLHVGNLPDNYQGAYIYRLGADAVQLMRYDSIFHHWPEPRKQPIPYKALNFTGDFYQFDVTFDGASSRWKLVRARAVTIDESQPFLPADHWLAKMGAFPALEPLRIRPTPPPASSAEWDFSDCRAATSWNVEEAAMGCASGVGVRVIPHSSDAWLISPPLSLAYTGWVEVAVTLAVPEQPVEGAQARVYWQQERTDGWIEDRSLSIELPGDSRERTYHFFARLQADKGRLISLRVDPVNTTAAVQVQRIKVRLVP
jgi:hypothetical protein